MQSGKVRYNHREDTLLSLSIPMEAVLNKGENLCCAILCLRHVFLCSVVVFKVDQWMIIRFAFLCLPSRWSRGLRIETERSRRKKRKTVGALKMFQWSSMWKRLSPQLFSLILTLKYFVTSFFAAKDIGRMRRVDSWRHFGINTICFHEKINA